MNLIPTRVHGILDYVHGPGLTALPEVLRTKDSSSATLVSRIVGGGQSVYTMLTDFELGIVKVIPMRVHLVLDVVSGAFLAGAPWVLGYSKKGVRYWLPHMLVGGMEVLVATLSKDEPSYYKPRPVTEAAKKGTKAWFKLKA